MPYIDSNYNFLAVILIDLKKIIKKIKNFYPQVILKEFKYN